MLGVILLVTTLMEDSRHAWSHSAGYYLNGGFKVCLESIFFKKEANIG